MFIPKEEQQVLHLWQKFSWKVNDHWLLKKEGRCYDECNKEVIEAKKQYLEIEKIMDSW